MKNRKNINTWLLVGVFASTFSVLAIAKSDLFEKLDTDASGAISKTEAEAHSALSNNFELVDSDGDGVISKEEFDATGL